MVETLVFGRERVGAYSARRRRLPDLAGVRDGDGGALLGQRVIMASTSASSPSIG